MYKRQSPGLEQNRVSLKMSVAEVPVDTEPPAPAPAEREPVEPVEAPEPAEAPEPVEARPFKATLESEACVAEKKKPRAKRVARPKAIPKDASPPPPPASLASSSATAFASSFAPTLSGLSTIELAAELMARRSVERRETKAQLYRSWVL